MPEMVDRFEIEVDTTRANEYWNAEVEENLKARDLESDAGESVSDDVPAEQHRPAWLCLTISLRCPTSIDSRVRCCCCTVIITTTTGDRTDPAAAVNPGRSQEISPTIRSAPPRSPTPPARTATATSARGCCRWIVASVTSRSPSDGWARVTPRCNGTPRHLSIARTSPKCVSPAGTPHAPVLARN